jgi:hypothetical protein
MHCFNVMDEIPNEAMVLKKDTIPEIIVNASNQVAQSSFEGFARNSVKCFDDRLVGRPI